eukprot:g931.t1
MQGMPDDALRTMYVEACGGDATLFGARAVQFLQRFGLPRQVLRMIWEIADREKKHFLSLQEFGVAMRLVSIAQAGYAPSAASLKELAAFSFPLPQFAGGNSRTDEEGAEAGNGSSADVAASMDTLPTASDRIPRENTLGILGKGQKLYYVKEDSGVIDYVEILKAHPGPPAVPESYTVVIIASTNSERVERELNVMHGSSKLRMAQECVLWSPKEAALPTLRKHFGYLAQDGVMEATQAANFVKRSGLQPSVQVGILKIAGKDGGFLDFEGFCIALRLMTLAQKGHSPSYDIINSTAAQKLPLPFLHPVSNDTATVEENAYRSMFAAISQDGELGGKAAVMFLSRSGLSKPLLRHIWTLADSRHCHSLDMPGFRLAMRLIAICQNSTAQSLQAPSSIDNTVLEKARDFAVPLPIAQIREDMPAAGSAVSNRGIMDGTSAQRRLSSSSMIEADEGHSIKAAKDGKIIGDDEAYAGELHDGKSSIDRLQEASNQQTAGMGEVPVVGNTSSSTVQGMPCMSPSMIDLDGIGDGADAVADTMNMQTLHHATALQGNFAPSTAKENDDDGDDDEWGDFEGTVADRMDKQPLHANASQGNFAQATSTTGDSVVAESAAKDTDDDGGDDEWGDFEGTEMNSHVETESLISIGMEITPTTMPLPLQEDGKGSSDLLQGDSNPSPAEGASPSTVEVGGTSQSLIDLDGIDTLSPTLKTNASASASSSASASASLATSTSTSTSSSVTTATTHSEPSLSMDTQTLDGNLVYGDFVSSDSAKADNVVENENNDDGEWGDFEGTEGSTVPVVNSKRSSSAVLLQNLVGDSNNALLDTFESMAQGGKDLEQEPQTFLDIVKAVNNEGRLELWIAAADLLAQELSRTLAMVSALPASTATVQEILDNFALGEYLKGVAELIRLFGELPRWALGKSGAATSLRQTFSDFERDVSKIASTLKEHGATFFSDSEAALSKGKAYRNGKWHSPSPTPSPSPFAAATNVQAVDTVCNFSLLDVGAEQGIAVTYNGNNYLNTAAIQTKKRNPKVSLNLMESAELLSSLKAVAEQNRNRQTSSATSSMDAGTLPRKTPREAGVPREAKRAKKSSQPSSYGGRSRWTAEDDRLLAERVALFGGKQWKRVAEIFPSRSAAQCSQRYRKVVDPTIKRKVPWTPEEDKIIREGRKQEPPLGFAVIATKLPGRTNTQVRNRYNDVLKPSLRTGAFSPAEDEALLRLRGQKQGWVQMLQNDVLKNRSWLSLKNRWRWLNRKSKRAAKSASSRSVQRKAPVAAAGTNGVSP